MTIKDAAEQTGLTQKSIRFYESKGLLSVQRGVQNDYRQYTDADITQLKRIKVLRWLGLTVEELSTLNAAEWEKLPAALSNHYLNLQKDMEALEEKHHLCSELLDAIRNGTEDDLIQRYGERIDKQEIESSDVLFYRIPDGCFLTCDSGFGRSYLTHDSDWGTVDVAPPETVTIWDEETKPGLGKLVLSFLLRFFGFVFWLLLVGFDDEFIRWEDRVFPYIIRFRLQLSGKSNCRLVIEDAGNRPAFHVSGDGAKLIEQSWTPALWRYDIACFHFLSTAFAGWFWASCLIGRILWAAVQIENRGAASFCGLVLAMLLVATIVIFCCHLRKLRRIRKVRGGCNG